MCGKGERRGSLVWEGEGTGSLVWEWIGSLVWEGGEER